MKFIISFKQINSVDNAAQAKWCEHFDVVETLDMATLYALHVANKWGTPAKVVTADDAEYPERLRGAVVAYFGPREHEVAIDWIKFEFGGKTYRTDASGTNVMVFDPAFVAYQSRGWNRVSTVISADLMGAVSKARFAK